MKRLIFFLLLICSFVTNAHAQAAGVNPSSAELLPLCNQGKAQACGDLGIFYATGTGGVAKDVKRAATLYQRACELGDGFGCQKLGFAYLDGEGVAKDAEKSSAFFLRGCDGAQPESCSELAINYNNGIGVTKDEARAAQYADRGCKGESRLGCTLIAAYVEEGRAGYPKNLDHAVQLYRFACSGLYPVKSACERLDKLGYPRALAAPIRQPTPPSPVVAAAVPLVDKTAVANAAVLAGNAAYANKNFVAAAARFAEGCDAGSVAACGVLGDMYLTGQGVARNAARAATSLATACDGGVVAACGKLGGLFDRGDGVNTNKARAFALFNAACSGSDLTSCNGLGKLYETGQGTAQNVAQAAALYQKTCAAGISDGCSSLGVMYLNGMHFSKSEMLAESFFKKACSMGGDLGCRQVKQIAENRKIEKEFIASMASPGKVSGKLSDAFSDPLVLKLQVGLRADFACIKYHDTEEYGPTYSTVYNDARGPGTQVLASSGSSHGRYINTCDRVVSLHFTCFDRGYFFFDIFLKPGQIDRASEPESMMKTIAKPGLCVQR